MLVLSINSSVLVPENRKVWGEGYVVVTLFFVRADVVLVSHLCSLLLSSASFSL